MDSTVARFAKVLGAAEVQISGSDVRFAVDGPEGGRLRASFEGAPQRFMAVLIDGTGVTRTTIDVAPLSKIDEDRTYSGRITLHVGHMLIHIDSKPTLAIEIQSDDSK